MRSTAVFTIVQNETVFLRPWARHYCRPGSTFDPSDVYVLDHGTVGDAADLLADLRREYGFNVLSLKHVYSYDHVWLAETARSFQAFLLKSYDVTVFAAADEFLVAAEDGGPACLAHYLQTMRHNMVRAVGYEIVHHRDTEPPLDTSRAWLRQRSLWYLTWQYAKTLVGRSPIFWNPGFHTAANVSPRTPASEQLWLLHLHRVDYDLCLKRHREIAAREWLPQARRDGPFRHNLIEAPPMLDRWLLCDSDDTSRWAKLRRMPGWLREMF